MRILTDDKKDFPLGPSMVEFKAPEDCECEKIDNNYMIITLISLPECEIHLDIVPYDQNKLGQYYYKDRSLLNGDLPTLRRDIDQKFGFDPNDKFGIQPSKTLDSNWHRIWWRNSEDIGMDVWLYQLDGWMFRVIAGELKEEDSSNIRSLVKNIHPAI